MNRKTIATILLLPAMLIVLASRANIALAADEPSIALPGTIEAFEASDQYSRGTGYVSDVKVDLGDHVSAGQVMVVVDDPELARQVEGAKAAVAARKEMAKAAEAAVEQVRKAVEVAQSQLALYQADMELAQTTLKRQEELYAGKATTEQQIDEARTKARSAQAQAAVGEARVAMAKADLQAAQANRAVAESQIAVAEAEAQRLAATLDFTMLKAPFDGLISRRLVNRGDLLMSNRATLLLTVQRIDQVRIFCDVPEGSAAGVAVGAPVTVKPFAIPGKTISAKVTRIAGALDPATRTMRVEIDVPNSDETLRPGMYAQINLTLRPAVATATTKP
jgi:multidrug resistance efflux pump